MVTKRVSTFSPLPRAPDRSFESIVDFTGEEISERGDRLRIASTNLVCRARTGKKMFGIERLVPARDGIEANRDGSPARRSLPALGRFGGFSDFCDGSEAVRPGKVTTLSLAAPRTVSRAEYGRAAVPLVRAGRHAAGARR
jgi:hypothetical protein